MNDMRKLMETVKPLFENTEGMMSKEERQKIVRAFTTAGRLIQDYQRYFSVPELYEKDPETVKAAIEALQEKLKIAFALVDSKPGFFPDDPGYEVRVQNAHPYRELIQADISKLEDMVDNKEVEKITRMFKAVLDDMIEMIERSGVFTFAN
jgi:hypothetical protein